MSEKKTTKKKKIKEQAEESQENGEILAKEENSENEFNENENQLIELQEEVERFKEMNLRRAAEFENFKKRKEREAEEFFKTANANLIKKLLPSLDNFERSLEAAKNNNDFDALVTGIELVYKSFKGALEEEGLVEIDAVGTQFNPEIHEALLQIDRDDVGSNVVVDQHQKGYSLNDRILRPAQVVVNK